MFSSCKIKSRDNIDLYFTIDKVDDAKAVIVIVHGLAEHSKRYDDIVNVLNDNGFSCYRYDNRGHGRSSGETLDLTDYNLFVEDADLIVEMAKKDNPNIPIYMFGHSMGGFIAALYGEKYPNKLNGQILSGAATSEPLQINNFLKKVIKIGNMIAPKFRVKNDLSALVCRDENVVKKYRQDPLIHKKTTMRFYNQFIIEGISFLQDNISKYDYSCLILHGKDDKIVSYKSSEYFYNHISSKDKSIKIYDGLYHEIFNEKEKEIVYKDIIEWLNEKSYTYVSV